MRVVWDAKAATYLCAGHGFEFRAEIIGLGRRIVEASVFDTAGTGEFLDILEMDAPGNAIPEASVVAATFEPRLRAFRVRLKQEKAESGVVNPIVFAAADCFPLEEGWNEQDADGKEKYWTARMMVVRRGLFAKQFHDVLFVERLGEMVYLAGIEELDGVDRRLGPELAVRQAAFIRFLRDENERDNCVLGPLASVSQRSGYATVAKATAAIMMELGIVHPFVVGYTDADREYKGITLMPSDEFDQSVLPFDELEALGSIK